MTLCSGRDLYVHTNVPAIYRRHMFRLLQCSFAHSTFYFNEDGTGYAFWQKDVSAWGVTCVSNWYRFPRHGRMYFNVQSMKGLLRQRWGSVHLVASVSPIEMLALILSGLLGHSIVITWNDGGFPDVECARRSLRQRLLRWLWRKCCRGIFTPGEFGRKFALSLGYKERQIVNAYFSHDVRMFSTYKWDRGTVKRKEVRDRHEIGASDFVILSISRFLAWKRLVDLAAALEIVDRTAPDLAEKCVLVLVGAGNDLAHEEILVRLSAVTVIRVNQMSPEAIMDYYCASDLFVFPSEGDIWGLVVNEALSMGVPVICADCIGAANLVEDGFNGYRVPARNPIAIAKHILNLAKNRDKCEALGKNALTIADRWNSEMGVNALVNFVESCS